MRFGQFERRRFATFIDFGEEKRRAEHGRARFPMDSKARAKNALARLSQAKGLTSTEKKHAAQRAANVLGKVTPGAEKYGVTRVTQPPAQAIRQRKAYMEGGRTWVERRRKVRLD